MSEMYGFGEESTEQAPDAAVAPKFYREYMDKVSKQLQALQDRNDALEAAQAKQTVRETLTAKGYAPEAANLYTGKPEGLNDWLSANGAALAKTGQVAEGEQQGVTQQGPPETAVSPESQAALAAMNAAAAGGAGPLSGDDQLAARLDAAATPEEFAAIMREAGNVRYR